MKKTLLGFLKAGLTSSSFGGSTRASVHIAAAKIKYRQAELANVLAPKNMEYLCNLISSSIFQYGQSGKTPIAGSADETMLKNANNMKANCKLRNFKRWPKAKKMECMMKITNKSILGLAAPSLCIPVLTGPHKGGIAADGSQNYAVSFAAFQNAVDQGYFKADLKLANHYRLDDGKTKNLFCTNVYKRKI